MRIVPILSPVDAGALVKDRAVVSVSSSSGLGCPDAVLQGIGERYAATGSPQLRCFKFYPNKINGLLSRTGMALISHS